MGARKRWWSMLESEGENRMIKQIVKVLKEIQEISGYKVIENTEQSNQAFYVLGKLETVRLVETKEAIVTIYHNNGEYLGTSSFIVSHNLTKKALMEKISDAIFAAKFVKNKPFELVKGEKKKTFKSKPINEKPVEIIEEIATIFNNEKTDNAKFNALEIFLNTKISHLVNSNGVDLTKTIHNIEIEAIPSYDGPNDKVELYKNYKYLSYDKNQITEDAKNAIKDVEARYNAKKLENVATIDIVLNNHDVEEFFYNAIADYSYSSVYNGSTDKKINDMIQSDDAKTKLNIAFTPSSSANAFDSDGIILHKHQVIEDGRLVNYYGSSQFGQYLGLTPSGNADELQVAKGKKTKEALCKGKYLEIIALSGIQIDVYNDYIGGEIRLAIYHSDDTTYPVSGISFSGSYKKCLNELELSKEVIKISGYNGPKSIKLKSLNIL